jgi:hypothetical protein
MLSKGVEMSRDGDEQPTVKVLFLAANPTRTSRLSIDEEMHAIA